MAVAKKVCCSFCGEDQTKVSNLIAGENDVYICNVCIDICTQTLTSTSKAASTKPEFEIIEQTMFCAVLRNFSDTTLREMSQWLKENEISTWYRRETKQEDADTFQIIFETESDLVAFKLRWI